MRFSLDVIRARKGDCLMLHYGSDADPRLMMIDGGPSRVYKPHLKGRIEAIREARNINEAKPLPVDVLMISHVDDDHIKGILDMTREYRSLAQESKPLPAKVRSLWHNSFDDMLDTTPEELEVQANFGAAAVGGEVDVSNVETMDVAMVLASIRQGRDLRDAAELLSWKPNDKFGGKLIMATDQSTPVDLDGGIKVTVVGPMKPELAALQKKHDAWLKEQKKKKEKDPEAMLAAFADDSIHNLSSIVVLAEADGKSILLTGDARGDKILDGLELTQLMEPGGKLHVDILKGPHHGSDRNVDPSFFRRITADHYVFSGDGEHGNPERETLKMLFRARPDADFVMHFTYPIEEIDAERQVDWEKHHDEPWSAEAHSLASFLEDQNVAADRIKIVEAGKPHVIDLLDEVPF